MMKPMLLLMIDKSKNPRSHPEAFSLVKSSENGDLAPIIESWDSASKLLFFLLSIHQKSKKYLNTRARMSRRIWIEITSIAKY